MKKFFSKIVSFLQTLFTNLDAWIHEHVQPSIELLQKIKEIVGNPLVDVITTLIPGTLDEKVRDWIMVNLTKAIDVLHAANDIESQPDFASKITKLIEYLRTLSPEMRKGVYLRLASLMAKSSSNQTEVKGHSIDLLTSLQYSKMVSGIDAKDLPESIYTAQAPVKALHYDATTMTYA